MSAGRPFRVTESTLLVSPRSSGQLVGFFVASGTGTIAIRDGREDGELILGEFTPSPGWYPLPAHLARQFCHVEITGDLDVTVILQ